MLLSWSSRLSLRGRGVKFVRRFCGRHVCCCVVAESNLFVIFVVVTFVFAWSWSQICLSFSWSSRLSLRGRGVKWMWRVGCLNQYLCYLRVALVEGSADCLRVETIHGKLLITTKHRRNSLVINWCLLSYKVKVINE